MPYIDYFQLADDYVTHLDATIANIGDPFIQSRHTGFLAVSAVTVYELAIKTIFIEFAAKKHKVLESFTASYFERINGRIKISIIKDEYISRFGGKYVNKFAKIIEKRENEILKADRSSMLSSYGNVITWRNQFAHEGIIPSTATYDEVKKSYQIGKNVIHCLANAMQR